jgi:lipopolysaccharide export system protein LptA
MSGVPNAMQGFSQNRDQPIQIERPSLEMRDKKKEATFARQCEGRAWATPP